jgi:transmembrane sensor
MRAQQRDSRTISEQAAEWLTLLAEGSERDRNAFLAWLRQSPRHVEEFLLATTVWQALRQEGKAFPMEIDAIVAELVSSGAATNVVALRETDFAAARVARQPGIGSFRIAAWAAAFALTALTGLFGWRLWSGSNYSTELGEQRIVRLADGSVLYLNTASHVRIQYSDEARDVKLLDGEALFIVARDRTRPFRVSTGDAVVQAVGTQFNVRRRAQGTQVSVIEGSVRVAEADKLLAAGEAATIEKNGRITRSKLADISQAIAWRERRLVFNAARLEDVVAEVNRYSTRRFHVEGSHTRETRLTATFDVDRPESLAAFLQKESDLDIQPRGDDFVIRER